MGDDDIDRIKSLVRYDWSGYSETEIDVPYMTYQEIGDVLGITRQSVKWIENRAITKLRRMMKTHNKLFDCLMEN